LEDKSLDCWCFGLAETSSFSTGVETWNFLQLEERDLMEPDQTFQGLVDGFREIKGVLILDGEHL